MVMFSETCVRGAVPRAAGSRGRATCGGCRCGGGGGGGVVQVCAISRTRDNRHAVRSVGDLSDDHLTSSAFVLQARVGLAAFQCAESDAY